MPASPARWDVMTVWAPGVRRFYLLAILLYAAGFRLAALNRPFQYDSEATGGSFFGIMARNYLRFPLSETHGMPVVTVGRLPGSPLVFYADHPPLVPLLIAPVYGWFGVGEWQTRLPTSIATILAIGLLYILVFGDLQQWPEPAAGLVFPAIYRRSLGGFHAYLVGHYPRVPPAPEIAGKFEIFDLRRRVP